LKCEGSFQLKIEIQFLIEETFGFDEDIDDDRDIKKKKLAFKDEITKAKNKDYS
jgi:hypothetical protein